MDTPATTREEYAEARINMAMKQFDEFLQLTRKWISDERAAERTPTVETQIKVFTHQVWRVRDAVEYAITFVAAGKAS